MNFLNAPLYSIKFHINQSVLNVLKSFFCFFFTFSVVNELVIIHVYHNSIISCNYKL